MDNSSSKPIELIKSSLKKHKRKHNHSDYIVVWSENYPAFKTLYEKAFVYSLKNDRYGEKHGDSINYHCSEIDCSEHEHIDGKCILHQKFQGQVIVYNQKVNL